MTAADAMFLLGPVGALAVVPASVAILVWSRPRTWAIWVGVMLVATVAAGWLAYWVNWGWAFEYADAFQPIPAALAARQERLSAVTAVSTIGLAMAAVACVASKRARES